MILMVLMAGATYSWGVFYNGVEDYVLYYKLDVIDTTFSLYLFPLAYIYFKSLRIRNWFRWTDLFWLVPGGLIGMVSVILYSAMGEADAAGYIKESYDNSGHLEVYSAPIYQVHFFVNIIVYYIVLSAQVLFMLVAGTFQLVAARGYLRAFFSSSATVLMKRNRVVLVGLLSLLFVFLTAFLGEYYLSFDFNPIAPYVMAFTGLVFFFLGYNVYFQTTSVSSVSEEAEMQQPEESSLYAEQSEEAVSYQPTILERFNQLVEEKFYLRKNLRVEDVADMLHTNRTYVSKLLKEEFGCSFLDFINRKRIEYACELMRTSPKLTQEQIAEMTGFVHASSFSRLFKQYTNMTFREAQKQH
ncbi:helix-turn-helix transcriptional regulator [Odoribacter sp. OttesenSCG-928-G04]|nr:helix-turn-helix transcriptional regulator [Odoribacter sp. OttesenSCG-928-G04]